MSSRNYFRLHPRGRPDTDGMDTVDIAKVIGVTPSRILQIEKRALRRLWREGGLMQLRLSKKGYKLSMDRKRYKLSEKTRLYVKNALQQGQRQADLARQLGVNKSLVRGIWRRAVRDGEVEAS